MTPTRPKLSGATEAFLAKTASARRVPAAPTDDDSGQPLGSTTPEPGSSTTDGQSAESETATSKKAGKEKSAGPSQATLLVRMATKSYVVGCTPAGEPFAIPKTGPRIVRLLRGGRGSLRAELARAYYATTGTAPSQSALSDACTVIEGEAMAFAGPTDLHLRVARHGPDLVLDLGDNTGRAVVITTAGWQLVNEAPVLFRRTAVTGELPVPEPGADLSLLWDAVNITTKYRPLVLAVLVAELIPDIPHPVVLITGEHGTGKTTATARLASIVDPSPAQVRKPPRDVETWTTAAAGSWVVAIDNLSSMQDWQSDAICRVVTGDGDVRRRLYSDGDLHVVAFRRATIINGIDLGDLRGDLADRLVHIVLDRIPNTERRSDKAMAAQWRQAHPRVLGALLDLAVKVLAALPGIDLAELPRMADYAQILAAVDHVLNTDGLNTYLCLADDLAAEAITSDPVLAAIAGKVTTEWTGTSADLLALITPLVLDEHGRTPKDWPKARGLTTVLRRQAPTLRRLGWTVNELPKDHRARALRFQLIPPPQDLREGEKDARSTRDARNSDASAGQQLFEAASDSASENPGCERHASDARNPNPDARNVARTFTPPLTSTNGVAASDPSVTSDLYPSPHMSYGCGCDPSCPDGACPLDEMEAS